MKNILIILFVLLPTLLLGQNKVLSNTKPNSWSNNKQYFTPYGPFNWQAFVPSLQTNKVPLVIWLHGGAVSTGIPDVETMKYFTNVSNKYPCYIFVPCSLKGKNWVSEKGEKVGNNIPAKPTTSVKAVMLLLKRLIRENPIDPNRIYIGGASGGGYGTFAFIQAYPEMFAAAYPIASNGRTDLVKNLCEMRIWMFHGRNDNSVLVKYPKRVFEAMVYACGTGICFGYTPWDVTYAAGNKRLTVFTYDGHSVEYKYIFTAPDFMPWLFDRL